jgi:hypothetical protein
MLFFAATVAAVATSKNDGRVMSEVQHKILAVAAVAPLIGALSGASVPPSVYWVSTPAIAGDTVIVAGAGLAGATVSLAGSGPGCSAAAHAASTSTTVWEQSVKALLPVGCGPPCNVTIGTATGSRVVVVNAPEVEWVANEGVVFQGAATVVRVFGRGLAWEAAANAADADAASSGWRCASGRSRNRTPSTSLVFRAPQYQPPPHGANSSDHEPAPAASAAFVLGASSATCYEASFALPAGLALELGFHSAELVTPWGSAAVPLHVVPAAPQLVVRHFEVDRDFGGDVHAALLGAAKATASGREAAAVVQLGARLYTLSRTIELPNRTVLSGMSASTTTLLFELAGPRRQDFSHDWNQSAAVAAAGADSAVRDLSLVLRSPPFFPTAAIWMLPSATNFSATRLVLTLEGTNVSNAVRVEGNGFELGNTTISQTGTCPSPMTYGPGGQTFPGARFQQRVQIYLHGATDGWIHSNEITWRCGGWIDGDVSDRVVIEDNRVVCTSTGDNRTRGIDGGNSLSAYDINTHPSSTFWSVARDHTFHQFCADFTLLYFYSGTMPDHSSPPAGGEEQRSAIVPSRCGIPET